MGDHFTDFWAFAGGRWKQAGLRERLLRWQDRYDLDVILFLFACWYPHRLSGTQWATVQRTAEAWDVHIRRIRHLRRRLKDLNWPQGYRTCLKLELDAERREAQALVSLTPHRAPAPPRRPPMPHPPSERTPELDLRLARLFPQLPAQERRTRPPPPGQPQHDP